MVIPVQGAGVAKENKYGPWLRSAVCAVGENCV